MSLTPLPEYLQQLLITRLHEMNRPVYAMRIKEIRVSKTGCWFIEGYSGAMRSNFKEALRIAMKEGIFKCGNRGCLNSEPHLRDGIRYL